LTVFANSPFSNPFKPCPAARPWLLATAMLALAAPSSALAGKRVLQPPWAFQCTFESAHLPAVHADTEKVFQYGLYRMRQRARTTLLETQIGEFNEVARYLRVAHAHGHPKAGWHLMNWLYVLVDQEPDGLATPLRRRRAEEVRWVRAQMIERGLPDGYLSRGGFAKQNWNLQQALDDYRRAADLGSPEAQSELADWLEGSSIMAKVVDVADRGTRSLATALNRCAAQQGHAPSITVLAKELLRQKAFSQALPMLQRAVEAGSAGAAYTLVRVFSGEPQGGRLFRSLAAKPDTARAERYERIRVYLIKHQEHRNTLPDLERIVPLPPASLPEWAGTFQWEMERRPMPERPTEALMQRLCREKALDP